MELSSARWLGLAGVLIVLLSSAITALLYRGNRGERYSVLNHFVSELGEVGVSKAAVVFNTGLILGGLLLLPFLIALGLALNSWLGWLGVLAGVIAGLALAAVGLFPMNDLERHSLAAMTYFRLGLAMVILFGLAFLFQSPDQPVIPPWTNLLSLMAVGSYASFLFLARPKPEEVQMDVLEPDNEQERPGVWTIAIVEWLVFFSTVLWILGIAIVV